MKMAKNDANALCCKRCVALCYPSLLFETKEKTIYILLVSHRCKSLISDVPTFSSPCLVGVL